jgi:ABC-2 type transport system ATP-binding protein
MIELRSLTKRYGSFTAVNAVDLDVPAANCSASSGLTERENDDASLIAGILRPSSGTVRIAGIDLAAEPVAAKQKLGFIPDRPFIYEKLTGVEFLRFVAGLYGQAGAEVERRGRELLALFDLEEWRDELVESYSDGMRQKLIISSAFVHKPEVIVVDDPMVGLDPKAARTLRVSSAVHASRPHDHVHAHARGGADDVRSHRDHTTRCHPRLWHHGRPPRRPTRASRGSRTFPPPNGRRTCP